MNVRYTSTLAVHTPHTTNLTMFPILAKAAIRATGLAGYAIPSFTFTFATTAIAVESHPTATPLDKSVHETETEDKPRNFLVESLARSESTSSSRLASELQSMGINSPLEGRRLVFEERCAISKPASKITTRDADLKCLSKNVSSYSKCILLPLCRMLSVVS